MKKELGYYHSIIVFIITMVAMVYIAAPMQHYLGMTGLALTEIMLGIIAVLAIAILRADFKEVFPFKVPHPSMFFASLIFYAGIYILNLALSSVISELFPASNDFSESITAFVAGTPPALTVIIMAVMPAIFEELLYRGVILSGLKQLHHTRAIVLCCGVAFGIFHLNLYRFLPTALLGCTLAYISLKTDSLLINMIMHFLNNLISVIAIFSLSNTDISNVGQATDVSIWPAVILFAAIGAILITIGMKKMQTLSKLDRQNETAD